MSRGLNLTVPDEADEWPHEARTVALEQRHSGAELREEIDSLVGMGHKSDDPQDPFYFDKSELAKIVLALGGPQEEVY